MPPLLIWEFILLLVAAVPHNPQQVHESINKIEVQLQSPEDCSLAITNCTPSFIIGLLDLLHRKSGEACENKHPNN